MRFRYDADNNMLWAGERRYPVSIFRRDNGLEDIPGASDFRAQHPDYRMYTRQALVPCENQWTFSVIWGDATYSSNHFGYHEGERLPFIEEPECVEVGILTPGDDYGDHLWCDPLSYITTDEFQQVAGCVSRLPSKDWPPGPDFELSSTDEVTAVCDYIEVALLDAHL